MKKPESFIQARAHAAFTASIVFALLTLVVAKEFDQASVFARQHGRDEVRIELTSNGFTPSEVQHAAGRFAIAVENNALSGEYTLRLQAEDGTVLSELQVQKGSCAWTVSLQTGRYTLTEAGHPEWTCRIVIQ